MHPQPLPLALSLLLPLSAAGRQPPPIIDVHLHAAPANSQGPPPLGLCAGTGNFPVPADAESWPETFMRVLKNPDCPQPIWSPQTDAEVMRRTLEIMERRNVIGVTSGPNVADWVRAAPDRIIPAFGNRVPGDPPPDSVRAWFERGRYRVMAEVTIQYEGFGPSDPAFEPYLALAEELDVPVGIHIGTGPPGAPWLGFANYRARLHSPLLLEEALIRHPRLRVYVMHAGWPMLDDLLALMWAHPHVYVEVGAIAFALPRAEFHRYLRRIVEAGFGNRVMFGSDQMIWPDALEAAIVAIQTADFLSDAQKRDILYNNAARFLRLDDAEIAAHHGRETRE